MLPAMITAIIVYSLCFGTVTALAAKSRNRDPVIWFIVGLVFGVFGLIAILVIKEESDNLNENQNRPSIPVAHYTELTKKCPDCSEEIKYEAKVCRYCGKRFDTLTEPPQISKPFDFNRIPFSPSKGSRTKRCSKCYSMNYTTDLYCNSCGEGLEE